MNTKNNTEIDNTTTDPSAPKESAASCCSIYCSGCSVDIAESSQKELYVKGELKVGDPIFCSESCYHLYRSRESKGILSPGKVAGLKNWFS